MLSLRGLIAAGRAAIRGIRSDPIDRQVSRLMERVLRPDSNCIDVGALSGAVLREMIRIAPQGRHLAFEPLPNFAARLRSSFPDVKVWPVALAAQTGDTVFQFVETNPAYSGIRRRRYERPDETVVELSGPVHRLDDLVEHDHSVDFLKVDVEGGELGVFQGSRRVLEDHRPVVVFEHGLGAADFYETAPADIHALLCQDLGMQLYTLTGYLQDHAPLSLGMLEEEFYGYGSYMFVAVPGDRGLCP